MEDLIREKVSIPVTDGTKMVLYTARPEGAKNLPGIIVFQEAFGVNAHIRDVTDRFAKEGYIAVAPELFHRTGEGFEGSYTDFEVVKPHMQAVSTEGLTADVQAAHNWLLNIPEADKHRIASIGFCMGGRVSFLASTLLPLKAAACFYGSNIAATLLPQITRIHNPLLLGWGGQDKHIGKEQIDAITKALDENDKDYVNVVFSKADHGFFCDARAAYHPASAAEAWELVKAFFKIHLQ